MRFPERAVTSRGVYAQPESPCSSLQAIQRQVELCYAMVMQQGLRIEVYHARNMVLPTIISSPASIDITIRRERCRVTAATGYVHHVLFAKGLSRCGTY